MVTVSLFFVPWNDPENSIECTEEAEKLEDNSFYGISMIEAAEKVKGDLSLDCTYHMLRVVKEDGEVLGEMETEMLSTGRTIEEPLVKESLQSIQKVLNFIGGVADTLAELKE